MATGEQVTITLTAKDGASQTFQKVGRSAQDMGKQIDDAGKKAGTIGDRFNQAGARIGLAFSAAQGALTEFARAAAESEASQARLETAIENTGHTTLEYADALDAASKAAIQLGFDDEAAADAIATLTTATGDAATAIDDLSIAEDIARARKISLAQATSIVVAAEQGRMGALARLGISLDENASREERMAALQQKFGGQAEAFADTTAGAIERLRVQFENLEESAGAMLGQFQPMLAVLPGLSVAYSGMATAIGALVPEMEAASAAAVALDLALGPVGLAALAIAAGAALFTFASTVKEDVVPSIDTANDSARALDQTLHNLIETSSSTAPLAKDVADSFTFIGDAVNDYQQRLAAAKAEQKDFSVIPSGEPGKVDEYAQHQQAAADALDQLATEADKGRISTEDLANAQAAANDILTDTGPAGTLARDVLQKLYQAEQRGTLTTKDGESQWEAYLRQVTELGAQLPAMNLSMIQAGEATHATADATRDAAAANQEYINTATGYRMSIAAIGDQFTTLDGQIDDTIAKQTAWQNNLSGAGRRQAPLGVQFLAPDVGGLNAANTALAETARRSNEAEAALRRQMGAYYGLADGVTTARDAQAAFKATQDGIIAAQDPYTHQLSEYQTQLGYITDAEELLNQRKAEGIPLTKEQTDFLARADDAQARLQGGTEDATIALGMQAEQYAENMKIGDEMNQKLGENNSATDALTATINNLILALQGIPGYVATTITADTTAAQNNIAYINQQLDALNGRTSYASVVIQSYYTGPGVGFTTGEALGGMIPSPREVPHAQHGAALSGWSWVGEAGPELIYAPGARVLPHTASTVTTKQPAAGPSLVLNRPSITVVANDPRQFAAAMAAYRYGELR